MFQHRGATSCLSDYPQLYRWGETVSLGYSSCRNVGDATTAFGPSRLRWKVLGELTQDELHEAMQSLHRGDCRPPFGEGYVRGRSACIVEFRIGVDEPGAEHFRAEFHRVPDAWEIPVGEHERAVGELRDLERWEVEPVRNEEDRLGVAVFVVVGESWSRVNWCT